MSPVDFEIQLRLINNPEKVPMISPLRHDKHLPDFPPQRRRLKQDIRSVITLSFISSTVFSSVQEITSAYLAWTYQEVSSFRVMPYLSKIQGDNQRIRLEIEIISEAFTTLETCGGKTNHQTVEDYVIYM